MFYPILTRRANYTTKNDGTYYADYHYYLTEIKEDCQERCVYCDALLSEHGNEGFHIDHFRPYAHFVELKSNPNNLVLACSKCNIWKSKNWPTGMYFHVHASHDGAIGFIDPFLEPLSNYFRVDQSGKLLTTGAVAEYMLELLHLNRESRIQLRRKRATLHKAMQLNEIVDQKLNDLVDYMQSDDFDRDTARNMAISLREVKNLLTDALNMLHKRVS
ncbi:HNH endonuclease [Pseudomonas syringae]|uniref:HNH endonuclease n=1 Tax=Pseudomonas syringae TaxID=317 RepID=UPI002009E40D|nr:HNH endonuclease [Pseudomonas syringae]MCK9709474.1 HNH endonuclease [Pseudomonas syringae pv. syringae]